MILVVGIIGGIGNGISQPLLCIVFGDLIDSMGSLAIWEGDEVFLGTMTFGRLSCVNDFCQGCYTPEN